VASLFEKSSSSSGLDGASAFAPGAVLAGVKVPTAVQKTLTGHSSDVSSVVYNIGGTLLLSASSDKTVRLWDAATGAQRGGAFTGAVQGVNFATLSLNDELVLGCSNDNAARVWLVQGARLKHTLTGHVGKVSSGVFLDSASRVVTGSHDRTIKIWDLSKGYCAKTMFCMSSCNDVALLGGGTVLASAHVDKCLRLWDLASGTNFSVLDNVHEGQITCVAASIDGKLVLTSGRDNVLLLINPNTKEKVRTLQHPEYRNGLNWSRCCFSPDGKYVAAGSVNGSVFVWNLTAGKFDQTLVPPSSPGAPAVCVAWHPAGSQLAVTCKNNIDIWQ
jgi:autophagy-related protein 16